MLRQDALSVLLFCCALAGAFYLSTISTTTVALYPALIAIAGFAGEQAVQKFFKKKHSDAQEIDRHLDKKELSSILYYGVVALCGMLAVGYALTLSGVSVIPAELSGGDSFIYTCSIAIGEEQFFRGFIIDGLLSIDIPVLNQFGSYGAIFLSALIFMAYHNARYGGSWELMSYVLAGGILIGWANYKSKRISPGMLGHLGNNIIAFLGVF
jgi:membrane protease YdiL (CAAX protease family)